jgi:hypothetical protein
MAIKTVSEWCVAIAKKSRIRDHGAVHYGIARIQLCEDRPGWPSLLAT